MGCCAKNASVMDAVRRYKKLHPEVGVRRIAEHFGIGKSTAGRWVKGMSVLDPAAEQVIYRDSEVNIDVKENVGFVTTRSLHIRTPEQAMEAANIDLSIWEMIGSQVKFYETTIGAGKSGTDKPETFTNYAISVKIARRAPKFIQDGIADLAERLKKAPSAKKIKRPPKKSASMLELAIYDPHFGKRGAPDREGKRSWNLHLAERAYVDAAVDFIDRSACVDLQEIVIPLGGDFLHVNDATNRTPRGQNLLDVDGDIEEIFSRSTESLIKAVEYSKTRAHVRVLWIPGNHDPQTSFYMAYALNQHFLNDANVDVDLSLEPRKVVIYGQNMIGFTHGSDEPERSLPLIFVGSVSPQDLADTKYREVHIGHFHKRKQMEFVTADTFGSFVVRTISSLSGIDRWHMAKGYVGGARAAEAFLWRNDRAGCHDIMTHYLEV